jgi:hypothetical protein
MSTARRSDFGQWREEKLTVECAPRWWAGGRRGTAWRASSSGGGSWLGEKFRAQAVLAVASAGWFHGRRCRSVWWCFSAATAAWGGLRSALSSGQWFEEERGDNGKLIDFKASPDGGWSRRSSMRWLWKRWRATAVAAWRLEPTRTRSSAVRERRSKSIWPPQQRLAEDKDSGGIRGRWSPTVHGHCPRCHAGARAVTGASG